MLEITGHPDDYNHGINNLELVVNAYGTLQLSNGSFKGVVFPHVDTDASWSAGINSFDSSKVVFTYGSGIKGYISKIIIVMEYFKTS